jgi:phosphatidylserine/phosphatidylglycerophosphate/cardiolipin synthase-like enzyme
VGQAVGPRAHRRQPAAVLTDHAFGSLRRQQRRHLLESGGTYFKALLAAIDSAKHEILYETYIYAEDDTARAVTDA